MTRRDRSIRDGYVDFLRSTPFDAVFRRMHRPPRWRYLLAVPLIVSLAGVGIGLGLIVSARLRERARKKIRQDMITAAERSVPIMAYPLMANRALMSQPGAIAPALVIGTFDAGPTNGEMMEIAEKMLIISLGDVGDADEAAVLAMFEDERYTPGRRRVVPPELTGGSRVYAFDLMMIGDFLPTDTLELPMIPCVAEPGETGTIQMVPWWIADQALQGENAAV